MVDEHALRTPEARMMRARAILTLQSFVAQPDGSWANAGGTMANITYRETKEPSGLGAKPSYIIEYKNIKAY